MKNSVETIRFNRFNSYYDTYKLWSLLHQNEFPEFAGKYLKIFKKFDIHFVPKLLQNWDCVSRFILQNTGILNEFKFRHCERSGEDLVVSFIYKIILQSKDVIRKISLFKFIIPNTYFPNLTKIELNLAFTEQIAIEKFKIEYPQALENMPNLEILHFFTDYNPNYKPFCKYFAENFPEHCIYYQDDDIDEIGILDYFPAKILCNVNLTSLQNKKYNYFLQYLHVMVDINNPMLHGWDRYESIFNQCPNLKVINIDFDMDEDDFDSLDIFDKWDSRYKFFESRGIKLVDDSFEIFDNKKLQLKVAQESGIKWRVIFSAY